MDAPEYVPPLDALVADVVGRFNASLREAFEERAGIIEFDAGLPRAHAECLALIGVLLHQPNLTGLVALEVEQAGTRQWLLTTDLALARRVAGRQGAAEIAVLDPLEVLRTRCGGVSMLVPAGESPPDFVQR
jgi:hypothetical protein